MERMPGQVSRTQRITRDGLDDTRRVIAGLRGDALPGRLCWTGWSETPPRPRESPATWPSAAPEIRLALYRTAQEALINTARHAGRGACAEVVLCYGDDTVDLVIEDRRAADAPPRAAVLSGGGFCLTGMRERAELLGGSLTAGPTLDGFAARLRLPARSARSRFVPALAAPASEPVVPATPATAP
jgi:signal transduction histidine kinase